jgi:hypothetical protein
MAMTLARVPLLKTAIAIAILAVPSAGAGGLTLTATPAETVAGVTVTFRFTPKVNQAGDTVTVDFGDGAHASIVYEWTCGMLGGCGQTEHAYAGPGTFQVTASGTIAGVAVSGSTQVVIKTEPVVNEIFVATAAHASGYNDTTWRTDLDVHNPTNHPITYSLALLPAGQDNSHPPSFEYTLLDGRSDHFDDVLAGVFTFTGAAALRLVTTSDGLLVTSRTYDQLAKGSFGQFVPGLAKASGVHSGQEGRLIGLRHDPTLTQGFRTNLGLLSLSPAPITIEVTFCNKRGGHFGTTSLELEPFEFRQINRAFEAVTPALVEFGYISVKTTTTGGAFLAYASMVDNVTGDPIFIPASVLDQPPLP